MLKKEKKKNYKRLFNGSRDAAAAVLVAAYAAVEAPSVAMPAEAAKATQPAAVATAEATPFVYISPRPIAPTYQDLGAISLVFLSFSLE